MDIHVKVLGILHAVMGALGLLCALVLILIFGGVAGIVGASGDPDAAEVISILGLTGTALVSFVVLLSLPSVIIGIGLYQRRPWARICGIVLSIIDLFGVPIGTIIGIYGLWVLFSKDTERVFSPSAVANPLT
jgi:hypothetical protein